MNVVKYKPRFSNLFDFTDELNRLLGHNQTSFDSDYSNSVTSEWLPVVDVKEEPKRYVLQMDVPGVLPKDVSVSMERGVLTIKGERHTESKKEGVNYTRVERSSGSFFRRFSLPDVVDGDGITAKTMNGVLEVIIPKVEKSQSKVIKVEG